MQTRRQFSLSLGMATVGWPALVSAAKPIGFVTGSVVVTRRGRPKSDHSGVIVYLEGPKPRLPVGRSHEIRQIDRQFTPQVSVVTVGTTLTFPNDDKTFHNVFSNSSVAKFDLGQYDQGETKSVKLRKPGTIEVYCNIHEEMRATVLVVNTTLFALTDRAGNFVIKDAPIGTHRYVVWQRDAKPLYGRVKVTAGSPTHLSIKVKEGRRRRHRGKNGHVYPSY